MRVDYLKINYSKIKHLFFIAFFVILSTQVLWAKAKPAPKSDGPLPLNETVSPELSHLSVYYLDHDLVKFLIDEGADNSEAQAISDLLARNNIFDIRMGQKISVNFETPAKSKKKEIVSLFFPLNDDVTIAVVRTKQNRFELIPLKNLLVDNLVYKNGPLTKNILEDFKKAGVPEGLAKDVVKVLSSAIDVKKFGKNESFEILYEKKSPKAKYAKINSNMASTDRALYLALGTEKDKKEYYYFDPQNGTAGFFNKSGVKLQRERLIDIRPLKNSHISSGFGFRIHPVFGTRAFHPGVDYSAPQGTPVPAAGNGVIEFMGWKGGYGRYVIIRHDGVYGTGYGHLSRFSDKFKPGTHISKGQILGYVGTTGVSTGPHLHFEVLRGMTRINPMTASISKKAERLAGADLKNFKAMMESVQAQTKKLAEPQDNPTKTPVAEKN